MARIKNCDRAKKRKSILPKNVRKQKKSKCEVVESPHSSFLKTQPDPIEESSVVKTSSSTQSQLKASSSDTIDEKSIEKNTEYDSSSEVPPKETLKRSSCEGPFENTGTSTSPMRDTPQLVLPPPSLSPRPHHPTILASEIPKLSTMLDEKHHFPTRISILSRVEVLKNINKYLSNEDLESFKASCFGHLLGLIDHMQCSAQIIHYVLLRQARNWKRNEIWFMVNDKPIRFSIYEWRLITGLNCGTYKLSIEEEELKLKYRLRKDYFDNSLAITLDDLEKKILETEKPGKKVKKKKFTDDKDHLRLALLYCLEGVLLCQERKNKVREEYMGIVEDLDVFNKYPWGRECYFTTLQSLKKDLMPKSIKYHGKSNKNKGKESYTLYGFPYAFQVWVYEAIPLISKNFAEQVANNCTPRCLRWKALETPNYKDILKAFENSKMKISVRSILYADAVELQKPYMKEIASCVDQYDDLVDPFIKKLVAAGPSKIDDTELPMKGEKGDGESCSSPLVQEHKEHHQPKENKTQSDDADVTLKQETGNVIKNWVETHFQELEQKMDGRCNELMQRQTIFEKNIMDELAKMHANFTKMNAKLDIILSMGTHSETSRVEQSQPVHHGMEFDYGDHGDSYMTPPTLIVDEDSKEEIMLDKSVIEVTSPKLRPLRMKKRGRVLKTPYTNPTKRRKYRKGDGSKFNPFRTIDSHKLEAYDKWMTENNTSMLIQCGIGSYDRKFFEHIEKMGTWLQTDHIEEALFCIRKRSQKYVDLFDQKVAIVDNQFTQWLEGHSKVFFEQTDYKDYEFSEFFIRYVDGLKPLRGTAWENVHTIYMPLNIENKHWVTLVVNLNYWEILVLDSNICMFTDTQMEAYLNSFRWMLPYLLRQSGKFKKYNHNISEPLVCKRMHDIPQNHNSGDCAVYLIKHIEFHMSGNSLMDVNDDNIPMFRKKMACEIYNNDWDP